MKLEPIIQSEVSQKEKHRYSILYFQNTFYFTISLGPQSDLSVQIYLQEKQNEAQGFV